MINKNYIILRSLKNRLRLLFLKDFLTTGQNSPFFVGKIDLWNCLILYDMIDSFLVKNYKAFKEASIKIRPITLFLGANSVGKSSLLQLLLLLKQTATFGSKTDKCPFKMYGPFANLGSVDNLFRNKDKTEIIEITISLKNTKLPSLFKDILYNYQRFFLTLPYLFPITGMLDLRTHLSKFKNAQDFYDYVKPLLDVIAKEKIGDFHKSMTYVVENSSSIAPYDIIKKDIDRFTTDMENALANVKKTQAYKDYHNMDKVLDKVRAEYKDDIEYVEKQIKALYDEIEQLQASLNGKDSYYAKVRKAYEKKLKDYPDVEKAYKAYMSAQATYDSCKEKLQKIDEKIKTLKEQIKTAQADYDKKLANYKKILSDNGLSYEDNKLEDPDPSAANPVKTITLKAKTSTTIMTGKQVQIAATVKPADASKKLTWTSSNKSYATVNSSTAMVSSQQSLQESVRQSSFVQRLPMEARRPTQ